jgi:hypothetical protein
MTVPRKKLSDILSEGERKAYFGGWKSVKAAGDYVVPKGEYVALLTDASAHEAKTGTKGIKLIFEIAEGGHSGRKVFHDLWLTEAAKPQTKRDLDALGITDPERQLDGPIPQGIVVTLTVTVRKDDDGIEQNRVRRIRFLRIEPSDAFEPPAAGTDPADAFPFGANAAPSDGEAVEPSASRKPPAGANGAPARGDLFPAGNGDADAGGGARNFLATEKGGRR